MKNLLFTTTMLFIAASSIAQLYVKPTTSGQPSYVYAKDVQIYVEGAIGLTKNAPGPYEGSVYLRDQAQLFQGGTSSTNTGTGLLSVYQTTNADQYDYNFWSSPVGETAGATGLTTNGPARLNVSDDTTVLPTDTGTRTFNGNWAGISSADMLRISSTWLYKHSNETIGWQYVGGNDGVQPGYGFSMKGTNTSTTATANIDPNVQQYDFRGRANTGDIVVNLTSDQATLAGNPYPSALDLAKFFYETGNESVEEILFWDENRAINSHYYIDNEGGYGTWIPADAMSPDPTVDATVINTLQGIYTPAPFLSYDNEGNPDGGQNGSGATYPRRYAPIGQGFMINSDATGTPVTFKNSMRTFVPMDGTNSVLRTAENTATASKNTDSFAANSAAEEIDNSSSTALPYMRLNTYFPGSHRREMALLFSDQSTTGFDRGFDANHPMDATSEMAMTIEDGRKLVIQTIPWSIDAIVPLMVKVNLPGSIVLSAYEETNLPFNDAYLFDAAHSTFQLITGGNTATANIQDIGESTNRFYIVFKSQDQLVYETAEESGFQLAKETVDVFQDNRLAMMEILNPERFDIKEAAVFDMSGKLVHTERNIGDQTRYNFPTTTLSDGVYIVKLTTQESLVLDYKVTIFNKR